MLSYKLKISETKSVDLRLTSRTTVDLEDVLGMSPISALMKNQEVPELKTAIVIFHGSLQALEKDYTPEATYDLYDEYVENGGTLMDLIMSLVEVFKVSGFFKEVPQTAEQVKSLPVVKKPAAKK